MNPYERPVEEWPTKEYAERGSRLQLTSWTITSVSEVRTVSLSVDGSSPTSSSYPPPLSQRLRDGLVMELSSVTLLLAL